MGAPDGIREGSVVKRLGKIASVDLSAVTADFAEFEVLPVTAEIEAFAIAAMQRTGLRAMDALHIGTAQAARVDRFVTADARQAEAAQDAGLKTEKVPA